VEEALTPDVRVTIPALLRHALLNGQLQQPGPQFPAAIQSLACHWPGMYSVASQKLLPLGSITAPSSPPIG